MKNMESEVMYPTPTLPARLLMTFWGAGGRVVVVE